MHLQSADTPHLQHIQSQAHLESSQTNAVALFCGYSQRIKTVVYFRRRDPSWIFGRILNATLPNNYLPLALHQKLARFPGMFDNIPRNIWVHSSEYFATFPEMFEDIARIVWQHSPYSLRFPHSVPCSCIPAFIHSPLLMDVSKIRSVSKGMSNRLISKGISNISLNSCYWEKLTFTKLRFSNVKIFLSCTSPG